MAAAPAAAAGKSGGGASADPEKHALTEADREKGAYVRLATKL